MTSLDVLQALMIGVVCLFGVAAVYRCCRIVIELAMRRADINDPDAIHMFGKRRLYTEEQARREFGPRTNHDGGEAA